MTTSTLAILDRFKWASVWVFPLLLGACSSLPRDASLPIRDPNEPLNRRIMTVNQEVLRPAAEFVKAAIPGPVHNRLHDFNSNLREPRILVNTVLQGRAEAAMKTSARFAMNSVFGLAGLFDIASSAGLEQQSGDFGQTMFVWGIPEGPYVVRPYLGPATFRDAVGSAVDILGNPIGWVPGAQVAVVTVAMTGVDAADRLGQLKMAEDASIDFYSFIRSSYYQMRRAELRDAIGLPAVVDSPALDDPDAPNTPAAAPAKGRSTSGQGTGRPTSVPRPQTPNRSASQ